MIKKLIKAIVERTKYAKNINNLWKLVAYSAKNISSKAFVNEETLVAAQLSIKVKAGTATIIGKKERNIDLLWLKDEVNFIFSKNLTEIIIK